MTGALLHYITQADLEDFQPMKAMFGLLPKIDTKKRLSKKLRYAAYVQRALDNLKAFMDSESLSNC